MRVEIALPRAEGAPARDPTVWRALTDLMYAKGVGMRPSYAMLCVLYVLERVPGYGAGTATDVRALLPKLGDTVAGRLRSPADALRRARDEQLVESLGDGRYRLSPLGTAVVDAMPDVERVRELRGKGHVRCRRPGERSTEP